MAVSVRRGHVLDSNRRALCGESGDGVVNQEPETGRQVSNRRRTMVLNDKGVTDADLVALVRTIRNRKR